MILKMFTPLDRAMSGCEIVRLHVEDLNLPLLAAPHEALRAFFETRKQQAAVPEDRAEHGEFCFWRGEVQRH